MAPSMNKALAVLFGLVISVVLAELGLRAVARFHAPTRYLVTVGDGAERPVFETLEAYLASRPDLVPHRDFLNYWNNAFGLNDLEFEVPKPPGRFRIMALGDSFTYGLVPYPDAVMTRLEEALRANCPGVDLDLLNFGIGGTNLWDYKTLFELAGPTFDPDLVLVNLYLGNDGPDLFARPRSFRRVPSALRRFYLARYVGNVARLVTGLERPVSTGRLTSYEASSSSARAGDMVNPASPLQPGDSRLIGPIYTQGKFVEIMWDEFRRVARPPRGPSIQRTWGPTLSILDLLRHRVAGQGRRLMVALYPSVLQVYPEARERLEREFRQHPGIVGELPTDVDPLLPNRVVLEYCRLAALDCHDTTPVLIEAARHSPELLYKVRDTHWTILGNRVVAESQARWLGPLVCPAAREAGEPIPARPRAEAAPAAVGHAPR